MATYRLKRKLFGLAGTALTYMGGGPDMKGAKAWGAFGAASMGMTAVQGKKQRAEMTEQNTQALQDQKSKLNQLEQLAK